MSLQNLFAACYNEYDTLKSVILCEPRYITKSTLQGNAQNINIDMAMKQHKHFSGALREHGVNIIELPAIKQFPEQVFTRDIGFTLGKKIYIAEMANGSRHGEEKLLINWLKQEQFPFINLTGGRIEGGDVMIDRETIYVGVSDRTNVQAINRLQTLLPDFEVISVPFNDTYLHLDCVFNILSPSEALIYPGEIHQKPASLLSSRYDLIEVSEEEQAALGTNVLSIGNKKVFSQPINKNVNKELRARGYEVIEVDFGEIIKAGGAFRCCTMPLKRVKDR